MATPDELAAEGRLEPFLPNLLPGEVAQRRLFLMPRAMNYIDKALPTLATDGFVPGAAAPLEQADDTLTAFIAGSDLSRLPPHSMKPESDGVWELLTPDLRFFGWFWRPGTFIVSSLCDKARFARGELTYAAFREQTKFDRNTLPLDPPAFVTGSLAYVL